MSTPPTETLPAPANRLGECPLWCERTQRLWWVDVLAPALWSYDPARGTCTSHPIAARRLGSIALRDSGGLILACEDGLYAYDADTSVQRFLVDPEPGMVGHRKNDGRADPCGNFWVGTLAEPDYAPVGGLYRVAPDLCVTTEAKGIAIPNALAFDAERGRMYFADTRSAPWNVHYLTAWRDAADDASNASYTRSLAQAMKPWTTGRVYLNYVGDEGDARIEASFGAEKMARLRALKAKWDPDNVFHHNHNIRPAISASAR